MYVMEYLLYHLRPYGIDSTVRFENEERKRITVPSKETSVKMKNIDDSVSIESQEINLHKKHNTDYQNKTNLTDVSLKNMTNHSKNATTVTIV